MGKHPTTLVILNGKGANNPELRSAIQVMREEGYPIHVRVTWEHGDLARYVDEAIALGVETVVAGGGDGTINEAATALAQRDPAHRPALGILPLGTANDFATSIGIPVELDKALQLALVGRAVDIDLVEVNQSAFFINMATGGFGTRITTETPEKLKAAIGGASYFIHGLLRLDTLKPDRCEIRGENFSWKGDALVIGLGNGRQAGGGQKLCPQALINDGLLDLRLLINEEFLPSLFTTLIRPEESPGIIGGQSSWFEIKAPHGMTFNLDGEPLKGTEFRLEVRPNALSCRLPPNSPLLG